MLRIKYELPVSNYFWDNGELTFALHVAIEGLTFTQGIPTEGEHSVLSDGLHLWVVMEHIITYKIEGNTLTVWSVAPAA
jgi:hypothetical protein